MTVRLASLFSGIGGFELGFQRANRTVETVFSSEIDKYARSIYRHNFGVEPHGDIKKIDAADVPDHDILVGGFPCQDVSVAGKQEGLCGQRSGMFFEIIRILREKQPRLVLIENVRGLLSSNRGWDFARVLIELENVGYTCEWQVLNSKNHGVPQNRERVFIIGHLGGFCPRPILPIPESDGPVPAAGDGGAVCTGTLSEVDRPDRAPWDGSTTLISNCIGATYHKGVDNHGERTVILCDSGQARCAQIRYDMVAPLCTNLGTWDNNAVVDTKSLYGSLRRLTPTECERLQGFPLLWTSLGVDEHGDTVTISDTQRYKCIGNAVTVPVVEFIAEAMLS